MTTMMGVPAIYLFMSQASRASRAPTCRACGARSSAARRCPRRCSRRWQRRGVDIVQGYGLTEAAPNVLCLPPEDAVRKTGYAGKPYPYVDALATRLPASCSRASEGELLVQGPNVFAGYWRNDEATRAAFTDGDWLRTGDIAERDDEGYYRIRGRLKDMVISGGENVYPAEVESALLGAPGGRRRGRRGRAGRALGRGRRRLRRRCARHDGERRRAARVLPCAGSRATRCRRASPSSRSCRDRR